MLIKHIPDCQGHATKTNNEAIAKSIEIVLFSWGDEC